jgi:predicted amidohydrolase YtcJ
MPLIKLAIVMVAVLALGAACAGASTAPDTILVNGKVFTSSSEQLWAEAVAIRGERIVAIGDSGSITASAGASTRRIDLDGRTVIPGINDAHVHVRPRLETFGVDVGEDPTTQQVAAAIAEAHATAPASIPLSVQVGARAWDDVAMTRTWLDGIVAGRPVIVNMASGHGVLLNSAALTLAGLDESIQDPEGGTFQRDPEGRLSGRAEEYADLIVERRLSALVPPADRPASYRRFSTEAARFGITSLHLMGDSGPHAEIVRAVVSSASPLRWRILRWPIKEYGRETQDSKTHLPPQPTSRIDARGMKWLLDGTPIERLAALRQPYADRPGESGRVNLPAERIAQLAAWAYGSEDPVAAHASGDRAIEAYLSALEAAGRPEVWVRKRPRLEHGDVLTPDLIPRVRALGMVVVQNPAHLTVRDALQQRLGAERMHHVQPMKSLIDAGIPLAIGSDGLLNPYLNILWATTHPANPKEALTREQAVVAYTAGSAYAEFAERDKGQLIPGALADLAVLSADLFSVPHDELPKIQSVLTLLSGRPVHDTGLWR